MSRAFFRGVEEELGKTRVSDMVSIFQISVMTVRKADMGTKTTRCQDVRLVMMAVYNSGPKVLFFYHLTVTSDRRWWAASSLPMICST